MDIAANLMIVEHVQPQSPREADSRAERADRRRMIYIDNGNRERCGA